MPLLRLCSTSELPPDGEAMEMVLNGRVICVAKAGGKLSAMDNVSLHRAGPLCEGVVEADKIICPWHGWTFDRRIGEPAPPLMTPPPEFRSIL
jgi:nitrite reductase (NADH) small subunit